AFVEERSSFEDGSNGESTSTMEVQLPRRSRQRDIREMADVTAHGRLDYLWAAAVAENDLVFRTSSSKAMQAFVDAVAAFGKAYTLPSAYKVAGPLVKLKLDTEELIKPIKESWPRSGCTLTMDGWTCLKSRGMICVIAQNDTAPVIVDCVDSKTAKKTGEYLAKLIQHEICEVGDSHVVQVVMDNAANNKRAANLLKDKYPQVFFTNCAAHVLDLMLHDMGKVKAVKRVLNQVHRVVMMVKGSASAVTLFRELFSKLALVRPGATRFGTQVIMIERFLEVKKALKEMVISEEWKSVAVANTEEGQAIRGLLLEETFWDSVTAILGLMKPIYEVLRIIDRRSLVMGSVYGLMLEATVKTNEAATKAATMASTLTATTSRTPPSESPNSSAGGTSSSTSLVCMDSKHAVYRHFKVPANSVGENGTKVCAYCNFTFVGGVHRCAQHITSWNGMRRREVHLCTAAPKTARDAVKALYESKLKAREAKRAAEIAAVGAVNGRGSDKKKSRMSDFYGDDAACANQAADEAISLFFAALHVPEHHADHPLWRNVVSSIQRAGPNYVASKRRYIGGAGLAKCRQRIEAALAPISASWRRDGVTVASDMFSDKADRPQANVLLINDSGAVFVESIDTKMEMKTGGYIAGILRPIIEKVGPENVVALCFDGGSNYAAACRVLMREYPDIEHIPCATHVLDLLMEDIGKKGWAKDIVMRGDTLISFVRNHHFTRGYMRSPLVNGGKGKQVLKPAGTRFGTNYIAINRLCEVRAGLTQMVLSDEWAEWTAAVDRAGADTFKDNILDAAWWTRAEFFTKLMRLPFVVMMGRLYDLMLQLTEDIRDFLDEHAEGVLTSDEVGDIREIVQDRWDNGLACNLHVIGRILYPTNQEECIFRTDLECTRVFKQYVSKHNGDKTVTRKDGVERRASLVIQEGLNAFLNLQGSFGMPDAIADRQAVKEGKMTAVDWWTWHGTDHPELTTMACRAITQPVSASPCERNWAKFDAVHTARRNRLGAVKLRDLVYVTHNWQVVHNWHKAPEGLGVVKGNIEDPPTPAGYNVPEEVEEPEEGEDDVMADEY
ncbi:unnamed protein product, partial [Closterium sp. NIES-65]